MDQGRTQHTWLLTGTALLDRSARLPHTSRRPVKRLKQLKHTYRRKVYSRECKLVWVLQAAGADRPTRWTRIKVGGWLPFKSVESVMSAGLLAAGVVSAPAQTGGIEGKFSSLLHPCHA